MKDIIKKIITYRETIKNKHLDLFKEIVFDKIDGDKIIKYPEIKMDKLFEILLDLKGTSLVEGLNIKNSLLGTQELDGDVCEFGVAQGKTSKLIGYLIKNTQKKFYLYDSFEGLPKPSALDRLKDDIFDLKTIENYQGKMSHKQDEVISELNKIKFDMNNLIINKGFFFKENLSKFQFPKKITFAYLDFDFYQPTLDVLNTIDKILIKDGIIIVDDYDFFSTGVKTAVDSWHDLNKETFTVIKKKTTLSNFIIIRKN